MDKVAIGIPTYNDYERMTNLIISIFTFTPRDMFDLVILDDGTKNEDHVEHLKAVSEKWDIPLIINDKNRGIPYSWNRLAEYYDHEYVVIFNDDIQIRSHHWLDAFLYFIKENKSGTVGFPLIHVNPKTGAPASQYDPPDEVGTPGRVGSPVGCSFGFKREHWASIKQPDGSVGFWEDLVSFYEELDFNFEQAKNGHDCYMIPYPAMEHWGSQTFAKNPELAIRAPSSYLPLAEYIEIIGKAPTEMSLKIDCHIEMAKKGMVYRMDYARVMFAKKWGCKDYWHIPQVECDRMFVDPFPKRMIKWTGPTGNEEQEI